MTTIITDGKSQEWQDSADLLRILSPLQSNRLKGPLPYKEILGDKQSACSIYRASPRKGTVVEDWHYDIDEFIYFLKGRMRVEDYDDGKTHIAKEGDLLLHKKGSRLKQIFEEDCETICWVVPKYDPSQDLPL